MKAGKIWGETETLLANDRIEIHKLSVNIEAKCSEHRHAARYNAFYVLSGTLEISVWKNDYKLCDVTVLGPGEMMTVPPGEWHQFRALDYTELLEIYYPAEFTPGDIERRTKGSSD